MSENIRRVVALVIIIILVISVVALVMWQKSNEADELLPNVGSVFTDGKSLFYIDSENGWKLYKHDAVSGDQTAVSDAAVNGCWFANGCIVYSCDDGLFIKDKAGEQTRILEYGKEFAGSVQKMNGEKLLNTRIREGCSSVAAIGDTLYFIHSGSKDLCVDEHVVPCSEQWWSIMTFETSAGELRRVASDHFVYCTSTVALDSDDMEIVSQNENPVYLHAFDGKLYYGKATGEVGIVDTNTGKMNAIYEGSVGSDICFWGDKEVYLTEELSFGDEDFGNNKIKLVALSLPDGEVRDSVVIDLDLIGKVKWFELAEKQVYSLCDDRIVRFKWNMPEEREAVCRVDTDGGKYGINLVLVGGTAYYSRYVEVERKDAKFEVYSFKDGMTTKIK